MQDESTEIFTVNLNSAECFGVFQHIILLLLSTYFGSLSQFIVLFSEKLGGAGGVPCTKQQTDKVGN